MVKKNSGFFLVLLYASVWFVFVPIHCVAYNNIESSSKPQADKTIEMLEDKEKEIKEEIENLKTALKSQVEWTNERLRTLTKVFLLEKNSLLYKRKTLESLKRLKEILETRKKRIQIEKN